MVVLVPTVLFQGAQRTKSDVFRSVLPMSLLIPIVSLPIAVLLLGVDAALASDL